MYAHFSVLKCVYGKGWINFWSEIVVNQRSRSWGTG